MSLDTYLYLCALIGRETDELGRSYQKACEFIPSEAPKRNTKSGLAKAHEIFAERSSVLRKMKHELDETAAASYKDHPNKKMREFWGVK